MPNTSGRFLFENIEADNSTSIYVSISNDIALQGGTATLDGININSTPMPTDGLEHTIVFTANKAGNIGAIGNRIGGGFGSNFPIYGVEINAASGNRFYPVGDGWSKNPVIADTISGQDGTANNFNEERWIEIDV